MNEKINEIVNCYRTLLGMIDEFNCSFYQEEQKIDSVKYLNDNGFDMSSQVAEIANELECASNHIRIVDGEELQNLRSKSYYKIHELEQKFKSIEWNNK